MIIHAPAVDILRERVAARPRDNSYRWLVVALILVDSGVLMAALVLAYWMRFSTGLSIFEEGSTRPVFYRLLMLVMIPIWIAVFAMYRLYDRRTLLGGTDEYGRLFHGCTVAVMLIIVASFIRTDFVVARAWLLFTWVFSTIFCITARFMVRRWVYHERKNGRFLEPTLIVGANPEGIAVAEQLRSAPTSGAQLIGFIDDFESVGFEPVPGVPVLGSSAMFELLVTQCGVKQVIIANSALTRERLLGIYGALDTLANVEVRLASGLFELLTTGVRVREEGYVPLVTLNKTRIVGLDWLLKMALDKLGSLFALAVLGIPLLILAVMVKLDSPGPAFYRRRVVGQHNRPFDAFKLRTMRIDGDRLLSEEQRRQLREHGKLTDDPRVTRLGYWLRRLSLDELPQLFNVLRGEMSMVGPRMLTVEELDKFGRWRFNLCTVKPGLSGLWQISGRSNLSYKERARLDMHYIRNYSVWLDLRILLQTPLRVLRSDGAY